MSLTSPPGPPVRAKVLVVDDDGNNRYLHECMLDDAGHTALGAANGERALQIIAEQGVDLVLLDMTMPGIDGVETCRRIRKELRLVDLPVVIVTGLADRASRTRGREAGCDDFLIKPVDPPELLLRVKNLLEVKAYRDMRERQRALLEEELAARSDQLLRADRLATLGTLACGVGHELANMVSALVTYVDLLRDGALRNEVADIGDLEALGTVSRHMRLHASHLLSLGRPGPDHAEQVDLREVVASILVLMSDVGKTKYVEVITTLPEVPVIMTVNRTRTSSRCS